MDGNYTNPTNGNYRVRMVIYDNVESTPEEPIIQSDEPLYAHPDEISVQAQRLQRHFLNDLAANQ